jgi:hypothetical protein
MAYATGSSLSDRSALAEPAARNRARARETMRGMAGI